MLDSSGSINDATPPGAPRSNYELILQFMANIVSEMEIGPLANRVGVVRFSDIGQLVIKLDDFEDSDSLNDAIMGIGYVGSNTNTSGGLSVMTSQGFSTLNGDRPEFPNVAVVITDGFSTTDNLTTVANAEFAHSLGIDVIAVGITNNINITELRLISSPPRLEGRNYFVSDDFNMLDEQVRPALVDGTCNSPPPARQ